MGEALKEHGDGKHVGVDAARRAMALYKEMKVQKDWWEGNFNDLHNALET
jgi:hypothetical protein